METKGERESSEAKQLERHFGFEVKKKEWCEGCFHGSVPGKIEDVAVCVCAVQAHSWGAATLVLRSLVCLCKRSSAQGRGEIG